MGQRPRDPNKGRATSVPPTGEVPAGGFDYAATLNGANDDSPYARPRKGARRPSQAGPARRPFARGASDARVPGELTPAARPASSRPNLRIVPDAPRPARHAGPSARPGREASGARGAQAPAAASAPEAPATAGAATPKRKASYGCGNEPFGGNPQTPAAPRAELLGVPAVVPAPDGAADGGLPSVGADFDDDPSEVFSPYEAPSAQMASKWLTQFFGGTPVSAEDVEPLDAPARGGSPALTLVPGGAPGRRPAAAGASPAQVTPAGPAPAGPAPAAPAAPGASPAPVASRVAPAPSTPATSDAAPAPALSAQPCATAPGAVAPEAATPAASPVASASPASPSSAPVPANEPIPFVPRAAAAATQAGEAAEPARPNGNRAAGEDAPARRPRLPHVSRDALARPFVALGSAVSHALRGPSAPRVLVAFVASVAMLLVSVGMLYGPSQELYLAMRQNERLTNELAANQARNEKMQARVDGLQTQEGIEDEARARFGLVLPGENLVRVTGLSGKDDAASSSETPAQVLRGSGENTHTWATDLLDRVFGVTDVGATTAQADAGASAQVAESAGADASVPAADVEAQSQE